MIRGLSDRRRMTRLGKIKLGVTVVSPSGKSYPKAVDYFVCPPEVQRVHGVQPKELPIMFPTDEIEMIFPQELKFYKTSGLFCKGDGSVAHRWDESGQLVERSCPCEYYDNECKPLATLQFLLPHVPGFGVWHINTSSKNSIVSLNTTLERFSRTFGGLTGIPFTLALVAESIQRFDEKKRQQIKQTIHTLRIDTKMTLMEIIDWRRRIGRPLDNMMLPSPETEQSDILALPEPSEEQDDEPSSTPETAPTPATEEWDVSMLFAEAAKLGLSDKLFSRYLHLLFKRTPDALENDDISVVRETFARAQSEQARAQLKSAIVALVNKHLSGQGSLLES